jgi:hypothetical protein
MEFPNGRSVAKIQAITSILEDDKQKFQERKISYKEKISPDRNSCQPATQSGSVVHKTKGEQEFLLSFCYLTKDPLHPKGEARSEC